ncbi:MAG: hypothetical protein M5U28_30260 [Sandaracinaceae bacterium]|nr:hypothetical protein [Sandaracinaceae bacterium]
MRGGAVWLVLALLGCGAPPPAEPVVLEWRVRFDTDPRLASAAALEAELWRGECDQTLVWSELIARGAMPEMPSHVLEPGTYCLRATAIDLGCVRFASASQTVELDAETEPIELVLAPVEATRECAAAACTDGVCGPDLDAGMDGGVDSGFVPFDSGFHPPDAGRRPDSGPPDDLAPERPGCRTFLTPRAIAAGDAHTCALDARGRAWCWGADDHGQLGAGEVRGESRVPVPVAGDAEYRAISAGGEHTCAVTLGGQVHCWGKNDRGQLGLSDLSDHPAPEPIEAGDTLFFEVAAGGRHTCATTNVFPREIYCWGADDQRQLGTATPGPDRSAPMPLAGFQSFGALGTGEAHTCAARSGTTTIQLACWGAEGPWLGRSVPGDGLPYPAFEGFVNYVTAGARHTCFVGVDIETFVQRIRCFGEGALGQLANGSTASSATPLEVIMLDFARLQPVAAGGAFTCFLDPLLGEAGGVRCAGSAEGGALGPRVTSGSSAAPVQVLRDAHTLAAGRAHACAVAPVGLVCWGSNDRGQLGTGAAEASDPTPARVCF